VPSFRNLLKKQNIEGSSFSCVWLIK
jgi:hypothetical protein